MRNVLAALLAGFLGATSQGQFATAKAQTGERETIITVLQGMIGSGGLTEAAHADPEWLRAAVERLIARGDWEVERLALRAAAPLGARIATPVSSTNSPPSLVLTAEKVIRLRNAVPYTATIEASLDGGELVPLATVSSGVSSGFQLDTRLGAGASRPGGHHLRLRARLTFGNVEEPLWTEVRDLPELVYAVYDPDPMSSQIARNLVFGPGAFTAADFDTALPREPLVRWLDDLLSPLRTRLDSPANWSSVYCDVRTADPHLPVDLSDVCSVLYFKAGSRIGQIWFRTAEVQLLEDRAVWMPLAVPKFEGIILGGAMLDRLSKLPTALQAGDAHSGDIFLAPADVVFDEAAAAAGKPFGITIVIRNRGAADLHNVLVRLEYGTDSFAGLGRRNFIVDVPHDGSATVRLQAQIPARYGYISAHAMQLSEHSPPSGVGGSDPTPEDACVLGVVNPRLAPRAFLAEAHRGRGCQVK